jgi:hypothetical protein
VKKPLVAMWGGSWVAWAHQHKWWHSILRSLQSRNMLLGQALILKWKHCQNKLHTVTGNISRILGEQLQVSVWQGSGLLHNDSVFHTLWVSNIQYSNTLKEESQWGSKVQYNPDYLSPD